MPLTNPIPSIAFDPLLMHMPNSDRQHLLDHYDVVDLNQSDVLCERGDRIHRVYFPDDCALSLLTHAGLVFGIVGSDGIQGTVLGTSVVGSRH